MSDPQLRNLIPSELVPALKPLLVRDLEGLSSLVAFLKRVREFGFDIETNVTDDFTERRIRTMQFGNRDEQYVVDLLALAGSPDALCASQGPEASLDALRPLIEALRPFLESSEWLKVGHGLQFEYETIRYNLGLRCQGFFDLLRAEQNIVGGLVRVDAKDFWGLENLVQRYCGLVMSKDMQTKFDLHSELTEDHVIYGALDVRLPMAVRVGQLRTLRAEGLERAVEIDSNAISPFGDMHLNGQLTDDAGWQAFIDDTEAKKRAIVAKMDAHFIPIVGTKFISQYDKDKLRVLEEMWRGCTEKTERAELRKQYMVFRKILNERGKLAEKCEGDAAINYGSQKQLLNALREMGYGEKKLPNTTDPSLEALAKYPELTIEDAFEGDAELAYPVIDLIRLYRTVDKQLSTYGTAWITSKDVGGHRHPKTGRIHSNINLFGTDTGRTASSSPNVQNLPKEKRIRSRFIARPGFKVLTIDMNGAELRILAEMSGEKVWLDAFAKGWDVHSVGAEILFGQEWTDGAVEGCKYVLHHEKCKCPIHKELRDRVKAINFGLAYGMTARRLSKALGITEEEAEKLLQKYKASFPTVMAFLDDVGNRAKMHLVINSMEGGRRRWREPEWNVAIERAKEDAKKFNKPVTDALIRRKYTGMYGAIEREGKNAGIQRTNAYMAKAAMYLVWLELEPRFGGLWLNFVHDELVIEVPEAKAEELAQFVRECFLKAGAEFFKTITMESEWAIENCWTK